MKRSLQVFSLIGLFLLAVLAGCSSTADQENLKPVIVVSPDLIPETATSNAELFDEGEQDAFWLNVGIIVFDAGIPENSASQRAQGVYPLVRRAETRYLPYMLRQTLIETKQWGMVRIMPENFASAELLIHGKILHSDGDSLVLDITVTDSTGRVWLDQIYRDNAVEADYSTDWTDPFQDMFNRIAIDMKQIRAELNIEQLTMIDRIATLRYGAELSPQSFSDYVKPDEQGIYQIERLPAENDPMVRRIEQIRTYEYLFIDTADEQYRSLFKDMRQTYARWRKYSRDMVLYINDYQRRNEDKRHDFRRGSYGSMVDVYGDYEWFRTQEQNMGELARGFNNEVLPTVMELDDTVVRLSGDFEGQYSQWREILQKIFAVETGL